nr:p22 [Norovirus GII]
GPELPIYNFDQNKVASFRKLAADNKYGLMETIKAGNKLKEVKTLDQFKEAVRDIRIKPCRIIYNSTAYDLESNGSGKVTVKKVGDQKVQANNELYSALNNLRRARIRYYVKCFQEMIYSLLQIAGAAFVTSRMTQRMNVGKLWTKPERTMKAPTEPPAPPIDDWTINPVDTIPEGKKGK